VREVSDVASGLSDKRRGLLTLMDLARRGEITDIAVTCRDRLTRFGFGYLEEFFRGYGVTIHVLDGQPDRKSVQEELVDDLLAIVTSFRPPPSRPAPAVRNGRRGGDGHHMPGRRCGVA
jgi:predicted site-specific integrase-resolvase